MLRHWGVYVDELFFLGGIETVKVLKVFRPHIFSDDQELHLIRIFRIYPADKMPYKACSVLEYDDCK